MKLNILFGLIGTLFFLSVQAAEPYLYSGVVSEREETSIGNIMTINQQQYITDVDTLYHGPINGRGESGVILGISQKIGFNIGSTVDGIPLISELWVINN